MSAVRAGEIVPATTQQDTDAAPATSALPHLIVLGPNHEALPAVGDKEVVHAPDPVLGGKRWVVTVNIGERATGVVCEVELDGASGRTELAPSDYALMAMGDLVPVVDGE